jgi:predicted protein tyrosine phosphatase
MSASHPRILVTSRPEAVRLLASPTIAARITHMISIDDPGELPPPGFDEVPKRLMLRFHDLDEDLDLLKAPRERHVRAVIDFARAAAGQEGVLLIHCGAGVSRSTAAALTVLATWLEPGREAEAAEQLLALAPLAEPNARLVRWADRLLGRQGALQRAVEDAFG